MITHKHVDFEVPDWGELAQGPAAWPSYRELVVSMGPVAYWRLGEATGATAFDEMNNLDATYQADPTLGQPGALVRDADTAIDCDGGSDYVLANTPRFDGVMALTVVWWAKAVSVQVDRPMMSLQSDAFGHFGDRWPNVRFDAAHPNGSPTDLVTLSLRNQAGNWVIGYGGGQTAQPGWHCYALVWTSGSAPILYLDGAVAPMTDPPGVLGGALRSDVVAIGRGNKDQWWHGALDEFAIWDQALTATQVQQLYRRGQAIFQLGV
jgi:hypothetical protein